MISQKDVITLKVPYPDITSRLAISSNMYICIDALNLTYKFVKCQSFKPYHTLPSSSPIINRIIVQPDANSNPFRHPTIIDLDNVFKSAQLAFPDILNAVRGINDALFLRIQACIGEETENILLSHNELRAVNRLL